jgi:class 3 adenylate cyclase
MSQAPRTGTVTLLFTDIEGSTRLLRELRDEYAELIGEHQRQLRRAVALHGGREVDTQGDAFFIVFDRAGDAIAAAAEVLRSLADTQVRVRIGIHTGEPDAGGHGYVGLAVHRAARICSAANGRQILISQATRSVIGDSEPTGTMIRELGEHALKDFDRPERLYQVIVDGLPADLRPIRTLDSQEAEPLAFGTVEPRLVAALEDTLGESVSSSIGRREQLTLDARGAIGEFLKSPAELSSVVLFGVLGVVVSTWLFLGAAMLAALFVLRHAVQERRRVADAAGIHLYAMRSLAVDPEFADEIRRLGALLVKAAHVVHDADERLQATDRRSLAQQLVAARASAVSAGGARRADALAQAIETRDRIAECRRHLYRQIARVEARSEAWRDALFEIRLGHQGRSELLDEFISLHADVEDGIAALREELAQGAALLASRDAPRRRRRLLPFRRGRWDERPPPIDSPYATVIDQQSRLRPGAKSKKPHSLG